MVAGVSVAGAAGLMAYAVRGRSANVFGPSVYRGVESRRSVALTFDDGPSEGTPQILEILAKYRARATFFQCGANVRRIPSIAREVEAAGHEIGNHSDSHPLSCLQFPRSILGEFQRAQETIEEALRVSPALLRAPFGVRWFGFREMQRRLDLLGVMWTVLGGDWWLPAAAIATRVLARIRPGAIVCLHDGRELRVRPDIRATVEAARRIVPALAARGYHFETVSEILCPTN
ncbi:MAG: polysaccharide deacetylase family protein [Acidobacteriota bacterium]|nr:polysaccharide deacetylase family protein [Acidobacteriota bacterium]